MTETEIVVRYAETDQMGVVHHAVYPVWFEAARTDMMEKAGYPYARIESEGIRLPLTRLEADYKAGAKYGERVIVTCKVEMLSVARLVMAYEVLRSADRSVLVTGKTVHAWTDEHLSIVNLKKKAPELFAFLEEM